VLKLVQFLGVLVVTITTHSHTKIVPRSTDLLPQSVELIKPDNEAFVLDAEVLVEADFTAE
jgi:hypothetical protein